MRVLALQFFVVLSGCGAPETVESGESAQNEGPVTVERHLAAMGTWLELEIGGADRSVALAASEAAVQAIEGVESRLSTWRDDTELARLNAHPVGRSFVLTPALAGDLGRVRELVRETRGAFDPVVASLVSAWGLRSGGRQPSDLELREALASSGFRHLHIAEGRAQRLKAGAALEEGGFGKGIGLDAAVRAALGRGATVGRIDLGGQVVLFGESPSASAFGLAHPEHRDEVVAEVTLSGGSLATSGNSERGISVDGERRSHILDPRTGLLVHDFGSLTVWAPDATRADALSTALYVMGPERALAFGEAEADCEVVCLIRKEARVEIQATSGWSSRIRTVSPSASLLEHWRTR